MLRLLMILLFLSGTSIARAQSLSVEAHYPASAYVAKRLLPFAIAGGTGFKIISIDIENGDSCKGLVDPFHEDIFHIFCHEAEVFNASVFIIDEGGEFVTLKIDNVSIAVQRAPITPSGESSTGGDQ